MADAGVALELEVERLYRLLGAQTQRRVLVKTYEVDVLATLRRGPMSFSMVIECKEYTRTRVSDLDMRSFVAKLLAARECGQADSGVFVTTSSYTKTALATAALHNVQCLTLRELYNQLVDFDQYVTNAIAEFDASPLAKWYVDQTGSDLEDFDNLGGPGREDFLHHPLIPYVDEVLFGTSERRVALLGNFGTGKSSFCLKYRDTLLRRWRTNSAARLPVLVSLADCRAGLDIHQIVTNELQRLPGVSIDLSLCLELQRAGRFIFILDGFDEMASKVDRVVINENLREIDRLHNDAPNIIVLTCRTHFFQERVSDEFLADYRVVYLTEWDRPTLEEYLQRRFGPRGESYMRDIDSDRGLVELSRTPMLVDMIVRSLSKLDEADVRIEAAALYEAYTEEWIVEQSKRRGSVMGARQRRQLVQSLATKLYCEERRTLHFSELYAVANQLSGYVDATRVDYFDTDARTSTFITRDAEGHYGFRHRSFLDYFVARCIAGEIRTDTPEVISAKPLSQEVVYFLRGMKFDDSAASCLGRWSINFDNAILSRNAASVLLSLGVPLSDAATEHFSPEGWRGLGQALVAEDDVAMQQFIEDNFQELRALVIRHWWRYGAEFGDNYYGFEELFVEVLARLWSERDRLRIQGLSISGTQAYLERLVRSLASDRQRLADRQVALPLHDFDLDMWGPVEEYVVEADAHEELWKEVQRVFDDHGVGGEMQEVFRQFAIEEATASQIAAQRSISEVTVRAIVLRCQRLLRKELRQRL